MLISLTKLRIVARSLAALFLSVTTLFAAAAAGAAESERELVILNWSDYLDPELVAEFEAQHSARVREVYFENDEARDKLMVQTDGKGYDLVMVDGTTLSSYVSRGWLAPINRELAPNLSHIDLRWQNAHQDAAEYGVPYFWGTIGIAYRADKVTNPITTWRQFFQPEESLQGRIAVIRDSRDLVGTALITLGHSPNTSDRAAIAEAETLLMGQKPYVKTYDYISLSEESSLVTGDVWAAMIYSGDALLLQEYSEEIVYVAPEEGTTLWVDYLALSDNSPNKDLAMAFLNFINEPENAARLAEYVYYPTPNKAAEKLLPEEHLEDETIYPSHDVLAKSEFYAILAPRAMRAYASVISNVTR